MSKYGIDVEDKLSKLLSEELAKSIDSHILQSLMNIKRRSDKIKSILEKIKSFE
jgi:hypothetical protein